MRLSAFVPPENILKLNPQIQQWMDTANQNNFVSIGVVGEAVHVLPGILESIEVSDTLLVDSVKQEGSSGDIKVIHGWADCDVSINLTLIDIPTITEKSVTPAVTRYDCLALITSLFKQMENGTPKIYTVHHSHIASWGAREFVFFDLKSSESRTKRTISCTLGFDEYDSTTGKSQDRQIAVNTSIQNDTGSQTNPPVDDKTRAGLGPLEDRYRKL